MLDAKKSFCLFNTLLIITIQFLFSGCTPDNEPCRSLSYDGDVNKRGCTIIENGSNKVDLKYATQANKLFIGNENGNVRTWVVGDSVLGSASLSVERAFDLDRELESLDISESGNVGLFNFNESEGLGNRLILSSTQSNKIFADISKKYDFSINRISLSPKGNMFTYFAHGFSNLGKSSVRLWSLKSGKSYDLNGRNSDFSTDGERLYIGGYIDGIKVINLNNDKEFSIYNNEVDDLSYNDEVSTLRSIGQKSLYVKYEGDSEKEEKSIIYEIYKRGDFKYELNSSLDDCGFVSDVSSNGNYLLKQNFLVEGSEIETRF